MSINAVITNNIGTHIGDFPINIAFAAEVSDFVLSDLTFTAVSGNGTTGVVFRQVTGSGANYMVAVSLPSNVEGAFSVEITGQVAVNGVVQDVVATVKTFRYDTIFDVSTVFLPLRYNDAENEIVLPVQFGESVFWFDKSDLSIEEKVGTPAYLIEHYVRGEDANYDVVFNPAPQTWGAICVNIAGEVVKETDLVREIVNATPMLISYNKLPVLIKDVATPTKSKDGYWNVIVTFEYPIENFSAGDMILGINTTALLMYRGLTLDVQPDDVLPDIGKHYDPTVAPANHKIGDWQYHGVGRTAEQGRYFYIKFISADTDMPEVLLREKNGIKPVSVAI